MRAPVGWWWSVTYHEGFGRSLPWGVWRPTRRGAERAARRSIARHRRQRARQANAERIEITEGR